MADLSWLDENLGLDQEADRLVSTFRVPESEFNPDLRCGDTVGIGVDQFRISDWENGVVEITLLSEDERNSELVWSRGPLNVSYGDCHAAIGYPDVNTI